MDQAKCAACHSRQTDQVSVRKQVMGKKVPVKGSQLVEGWICTVLHSLLMFKAISLDQSVVLHCYFWQLRLTCPTSSQHHTWSCALVLNQYARRMRSNCANLSSRWKMGLSKLNLCMKNPSSHNQRAPPQWPAAHGHRLLRHEMQKKKVVSE